MDSRVCLDLKEMGTDNIAHTNSNNGNSNRDNHSNKADEDLDIGEFWMELSDFMTQFNHLWVCRYAVYHSEGIRIINSMDNL